MSKKLRSIVIVGTLAAMLVIPTSGAFAADANGSTTESLSKAASISLTVPASITYADAGGGSFSAAWTASASTDNASGLTLSGTFSNLTGPVVIPFTQRSVSPQAESGALHYTLPIPDFTGGPTIELADSTAAGSGSTDYVFYVGGVTVPGTYSGSIAFVASTNP